MPLDDAFSHYEAASPQLLALQPPFLDAEPPEGKDWNLIYPQLESRLVGLREWRMSWWLYWATIAEYILPRRYHFLIVSNVMLKGVPLNNVIVDSTATLAMQT